MTQYESFHELSPETRQDLADWLLALADNKRVLGLRYAEWCTGAPELEADVAVSAMAQYELGHARLLRGVLGDLPEDPRSSQRTTDPAAWRSLPALDRPAAGWPELVVLNALVDGLLTVNFEAAVEGGVAPLSQRLRKAVAEEHYHSLHANAWFDRLLGGPPEMVQRVRAATEEVLPQCLAWFGPTGDNALDRLAEANAIGADATALRGRFLELVATLLGDRLTKPASRSDDGWVLQVALDYEGWSESTRRHGVPDFDAESFDMLTGAHARAMGVED